MASIPDTYAAEPIPQDARNQVELLLQSGDLFRYTAGAASAVAQLEEAFADLIGAQFALAVNSCSSALFLAMKALDLKPGARVLIPGFTFAAVPSAVVHAGCVPVLVEVDATYRIDMADFRRKLDDTIDAVLISHMRGHTSDMDKILSLCSEKGIPVIEDAAHSLGTKWHGRNIGTLGAIGCFSFQSYKLVNAGEGGILISDDPDIMARAIIMSGAYEQNWRKHPRVNEAMGHWQSLLPLFNMRLNNISAAIAGSQLPYVRRRVQRGRENHDYVAGLLNESRWLDVPAPLPGEDRAPDSIQFNLIGIDDDDTARAFAREAKARGLNVQIFGLTEFNARAFWNWQFLGASPDLPMTRKMLARACDVRLPARLQRAELDVIAGVLLDSAEAAFGDDVCSWSRSA